MVKETRLTSRAGSAQLLVLRMASGTELYNCPDDRGPAGGGPSSVRVCGVRRSVPLGGPLAWSSARSWHLVHVAARLRLLFQITQVMGNLRPRWSDQAMVGAR